MVKKILRNIRQKPKAVREQYAFWIACSLTSVVALVWVLSTMGRFGVVAESEESTPTTTPDSLSSFMEGTQSQIGSLQQQVQDMMPEVQQVQPEETAAVATKTPATSSNQAAAATRVAPTTSRQEIRIATTSATGTVD